MRSIAKVGPSRLLVQLRERAHGHLQREMVSQTWLNGWGITAMMFRHARLAQKCYRSLLGSRCGVKMLSVLPFVTRLEFEDGKGIAGILSSTAS